MTPEEALKKEKYLWEFSVSDTIIDKDPVASLELLKTARGILDKLEVYTTIFSSDLGFYRRSNPGLFRVYVYRPAGNPEIRLPIPPFKDSCGNLINGESVSTDTNQDVVQKSGYEFL